MGSDATMFPALSGPIAGGDRGWPFGSPLAETVAAHGYVLEEFFLEGVAQSYEHVPGSAAGRDGLWQTRPAETAPYKTRMVVVRPAAAARFNGVVLVNWQNVTAGVDLGTPPAEAYRGYAWVGVSTQKIAVDGIPAAEGPHAYVLGSTKGLAAWDPPRYGSLHHPGDAFSYDIFTQAARLLRSGRPAGAVDPLGGLVPEVVLALGASQSATRLASYVNAVHAHARVFDGFLPSVHWGVCPPLVEAPMIEGFTLEGGLFTASCRIRDDLGTPVLALNTECEALHNYPVRQPDTATFRHWEIAGAAHVSCEDAPAMDALFARDGVPRMPAAPDRNAAQWGYVLSAAIRALAAWVRTKTPPPVQPRMAIAPGNPGVVQRDELGNARGGVRLPELEAPTAVHLGQNQRGPLEALSGETRPFAAAQLAALYPSPAAYRERWDAAVDHLLASGALLPEDAAAVHARGQAIAKALPGA